MSEGRWGVVQAFIIVVAVVGVIAAIVAVDRIWLDPGGRGLAGEANDQCREHGGVAVIRAQEGVIVCRDGWAVE